jgi:uncharacterized membrane protein
VALLTLAVGVALFMGVHLIPMMPKWRAAFVGRIGERAYKVGFSVLALSGLVGAIVAYRYTPHVPLWLSPPAIRILTAVLMLAAVLGFAGAKGAPWFKRVVRHPMLWGDRSAGDCSPACQRRTPGGDPVWRSGGVWLRVAVAHRSP